MPDLRIVLVAIALAGSAHADAAFDRIENRTEFESTVVGREMSIMGIRVTVTPDGHINGKAYGRPVKGKWRWSDGYFCRDLSWGEMELEPNCQEVRINGKTVRFQSDRGTGRFADLRMR